VVYSFFLLSYPQVVKEDGEGNDFSMEERQLSFTIARISHNGGVQKVAVSHQEAYDDDDDDNVVLLVVITPWQLFLLATLND